MVELPLTQALGCNLRAKVSFFIRVDLEASRGGTLSESHTPYPDQSIRASVSSRVGRDDGPWVERHWDRSPSSHWRHRSHVPVQVREH